MRRSSAQLLFKLEVEQEVMLCELNCLLKFYQNLSKEVTYSKMSQSSGVEEVKGWTPEKSSQ